MALLRGREQISRFLLQYCVIYVLLVDVAICCGPGRSGFRRRGSRKMTPLVFKQHMPNIKETTFGASGTSEGRITRDDKAFQDLVVNYNPDILFKNEEGTGADRVMTQRCKDKLNTLAIQVMNHWPGVKVRVTEGWDEDMIHAKDSLHYEGRALDITTSDRDRAKYGMLARLAVEAGFDWVYYEQRGHIHVSVKSDTSIASNYGGCFPADSFVNTEQRGTLTMSQLKHSDRVQTMDSNGQLEYSDVILYFHREDKTSAEFLKIETSNENSITITANHLIYTSHKLIEKENQQNVYKQITATFASNVLRGHYIYLADNTQQTIKAEQVINVTVINAKGLYAPLTKHGTIVVNNYVTSCYAQIDSHFIAHACLAPIRLFYDLFNYLSLYFSEHLVINFNIFETFISTPESNQNGVHWYADILHSIAQYVIPSSMLYKT